MVPVVGSNGAVITGPSFKKIVFTLQSQQDRSALTSFIIVDAQSVKNTVTAENKGYDAGKKISEIKQPLAVDLRYVRNVLVDGGYVATRELTLN